MRLLRITFDAFVDNSRSRKFRIANSGASDRRGRRYSISSSNSLSSVSHAGEVGRATPPMNKTRCAQNGKKKKVNEAASIPRQRYISEKSRDQSERHEGREPKKLVAGVEFFELSELERIAQTIRVQVEESHSEVDRREAQTVETGWAEPSKKRAVMLKLKRNLSG